MTTALEHSLKARIRRIARERHVDPAELWQTLVLERFLVRMCRSRFAHSFILKGGILLSTYVTINRSTRDLDFLVRDLELDILELENVITEVISIELDDGFTFDQPRIRSLTHPGTKYPGARIEMTGWFGRIRFPVSIDLGCGDLVDPIRRTIPLMHEMQGALFESHADIDCYPREFIFAEKLEATVQLGRDNSRMKDFHDLYVLIRDGNMVPPDVEHVVRLVFDHRGTALDLPLSIDQAHLQTRWRAHVSKLRSNHKMPTNLAEVVDQINQWIVSNTQLCI